MFRAIVDLKQRIERDLLPHFCTRRHNSLYEYSSIILTTNKDFTNWGEFFHDDAVAAPIIDWVTRHSHIFMLGGESYRLRQKVTD